MDNRRGYFWVALDGLAYRPIVAEIRGREYFVWSALPPCAPEDRGFEVEGRPLRGVDEVYADVLRVAQRAGKGLIWVQYGRIDYLLEPGSEAGSGPGSRAQGDVDGTMEGGGE